MRSSIKQSVRAVTDVGTRTAVGQARASGMSSGNSRGAGVSGCAGLLSLAGSQDGQSGISFARSVTILENAHHAGGFGDRPKSEHDVGDLSHHQDASINHSGGTNTSSGPLMDPPMTSVMSAGKYLLSVLSSVVSFSTVRRRFLVSEAFSVLDFVGLLRNSVTSSSDSSSDLLPPPFGQ
jgi:hypothetical protein